MNKVLAILMAIMLLISVTAVPIFAEGAMNLVKEDYGESEIVYDESDSKPPEETPKPSAEEKEPEKEKKYTPPLKNPTEVKAESPSVNVPAKENSEHSEPQIITEDSEEGWSLNLEGFEDFFSDISFGDIFGGLMSGDEPESGEPFEDEGNAYTRDVLYDKDCHKQFITIQTRSGNTFYIVIDYDSCINESEEQYQVYFLNMVDDADLLALLDEETTEELTTCTCKDKCILGKVNSECPVCKNDLTACKGKEPEPKKEQPPAEKEQEAETKPTDKSDKKSNALVMIIFVVIAAAGGIGFYYLKFIKGRKKEDMDFYDDEGYEEKYVNEDDGPNAEDTEE